MACRSSAAFTIQLFRNFPAAPEKIAINETIARMLNALVTDLMNQVRAARLRPWRKNPRRHPQRTQTPRRTQPRR